MKKNIQMREPLSFIENINCKIFIITIISLIQIGCKEKHHSTEVNIETTSEKTYIEFYYLAPNRSYPMRFNCGPIIGGPLPKDSERYYLKISDKNFTNKFLSKYKKLKVSDNQNDFDARIQGLIHFPDKTDTICMNGIKEIIINDIYMQATEDFSTLVNNEILNNYTIHKKNRR